MNKAEKIKKMLRAGATVKDVVKKLKVSESYVYLVRGKKMPIKFVPPKIAPLPETLDPLKVQVGGNHYKDMPIQPVEFIHANGIPYIEGAVIKYVCRWRNKNGINDLQKAAHFLELLMQLEKNKEEA